MKRLKKGFTIVELVIVIAVIGILAAVLIPTFSNVIKKSQISKDTQLVRNLNTALSTDEVLNGKPETMYDALKVVEEAGYNVEKINASATDNEILWNSKANVFCYLNGNTVEYIPSTDNGGASDVDLWVISSEVDDNTPYSTYYTGDAKEITTSKGFDAGEKTGIVVSVVTEDSVTLTIRAASVADTVNVTAPNAIINFHGEAGEINVNEVKGDSLHIFGKVEFLQVSKGRVVAEKTAEIKGLHVAGNDAKVEITSEATVKNVTKSENVTANVTGYSQEIKEANPEDAKAGAKLFAAGNGSEALPFIIETAEQLKNINEVYEKGYNYFKVADGVETLDCVGWPKVKLNGSFDGNGVKILNLSAALFEAVGYNNANDTIVIENFVADMYNTTGRALVRNIYNSGKTTFRNISLHGYVEGQYNMGSFYNYGTANLGDSDGADYTVEFDNATSDVTLVCTTGEAIGGMLGHGYEGADYKLSIITDEESCYTGKMYTNASTCYQIMGMCSHSTYMLNDVETSRYDNKYESTKIATVNPAKVEDVISVGLVDGASSFKININVQITAYDEAGEKIQNLSGMTWVADQMTVDGIAGDETAVVFDKAYTDATIINNVNDEMGIAVENGVLTLHTGSSINYKSGTFTLFVTQYDTNGNILAIGSILLADIK